MRVIDADTLEREGWFLSRNRQVDSKTMVYESKKPTEFQTIELEPCEDTISRKAAIETIISQPSEPHYPDWYASQIKELPPAPSEQSEPEELDFVQPHKKIDVRLEIGQPEQRAEELLPDGTLHLFTDTDLSKVNRILVSQNNTHYGDLYYTDEDPKRGKWIPHKSVFGGLGEKVYTCDQCGYNIGFHAENFCPRCGADMRERRKDV